MTDISRTIWQRPSPRGVYDYRNDRYIKNNLAKTISPERIAPMEDYLKAYIQQYIHRMIHDELTVSEEKK